METIVITAAVSRHNNALLDDYAVISLLLSDIALNNQARSNALNNLELGKTYKITIEEVDGNTIWDETQQKYIKGD